MTLILSYSFFPAKCYCSQIDFFGFGGGGFFHHCKTIKHCNNHFGGWHNCCNGLLAIYQMVKRQGGNNIEFCLCDTILCQHSGGIRF